MCLRLDMVVLNGRSRQKLVVQNALEKRIGILIALCLFSSYCAIYLSYFTDSHKLTES